MEKNLWEFIKDAYEKMPIWIQIPTFVIILFLFVYLLISPKFIDGELLVASSDSRTKPIPSSIIEVNVSPGRWVRLHTATDGRFTLPTPIKQPLGSVNIRYYPSGIKEGYYETSVKYFKFFGKEILLEYDESEKTRNVFYLKEDVSALFSIVPSAFADVEANLTGQTVSEKTVDNIDDAILKSASQRLNRLVEATDLEKTFSDIGISKVDLAFIYADIRSNFDLEVKSDIWEYAETLQDIVNFSREQFYRYKPWGLHDGPRIEKIRELFSQAEAKYGSETYLLYQDARILRKAEKSFPAINILNNIIETNPDFYLAWYDLALAYRSQGLVEEANDSFSRAIELSEEQKLNHAAVYNTFGRFLYTQCRPEDSIVYLNKTLEIEPEYGYTKGYILDSERLLAGDIKLESCD
ncbi:hypothetical protein [Reinekea sp. G2M2-21]|uniref:hypothetical protein n=1 Tax=Reinekea sp. G2M2-21 TaxID=2788942 RepID=UPI0018AAFD75|nr:hypothetical protein [Reinekea sp. G2M2-21]